MRKFLTFLLAGVLLSSISYADGVWTTSSSNTKSNTTIFEDDFEGFTVGEQISTDDNWSSWSGATAEEAVASDEQNHTAGGGISMKVVADNDMIYRFNDKTTGVYQVSFWYYIATGDGGYFNIQHDFGTNWALSAEMTGGNGTLTYDNPTVSTSFTYPQDTWFQVVMDISLDDDQITLKVDGTDVATWQFSLSESTAGPLAVLDCINFYGYGPNFVPYYVDDFKFIETAAGVDPAEADLSATSFTTNGTSSETLTITNSGAEELTFETAISYDFSVASPVINNNNTIVNNTNKVMLMNPTAKKMNKPIHINLNTKDETLTHFDGTATGSLGWGGTDPVSAEGVSLFKYDALKDYIGMTVSSVVIFAGDAPQASSTNVKVYDGRDGLVNGPMNLKAIKAFTPVANDQTVVTLDNPITVTGKDMFVGWTFTQNVGEHCLAMDAALTDDANWTKTGPAWSEITEATFGDFGIVAILTGTPSHKWLSLDTYSGTVAAGATQDVQLNFDLTGMAPGNYVANLILKTNDGDDDESYIEIPVTLDVVAGVDNNSKVGVMLYPNPATDMLTITTGENIVNVSATNVAGQTVLNTAVNNTKSYNVDLSSLAKGVYLFNITTNNQTVTKKVIVE